MLVYLAKQVAGGFYATASFIARNITGYTVASPSDLIVFGKPSIQQLAYDGYNKNIEAFICATSLQKKLHCDQPHYPINADHVVKVPISLPKTAFVLKTKQSEAGEAKMIAAAKGMGLEKKVLGKGFVWTIERPTIEFLGKLRQAVPDNCSAVTDYSQYGATIQFYWLMQCVDLFLATNTYSFKASDLDENNPAMTVGKINVGFEYSGSGFYANGTSSKVKESKRQKREGNLWDKRELREPEVERAYGSALPSTSTVLAAKPSPLPSTISFGAPAECPHSRGCHFPYFEGMMHSDVAYMRQQVHRHFFRNLGSVAKDPKTAFKEFRDSIGPAATTSAGRMMNHILYGIDLALDTQTQLFLLFDKANYLGFNLLGTHFSIWNGGWVESGSEEDLAREMAKYRTHEASLKDLSKMLAEAQVVYKEKVTVPSALNAHSLAKILAQINIKDTKGEIISAIEETLSCINFGSDYRIMKPSAIQTTIDELLENETFLEDETIFIPRSSKQWHLMASPYYMPLATFGARSFSLVDRGPKATEFPLNQQIFIQKLSSPPEPGKRDTLAFFEKPVYECVIDWGTVVEKGTARVNPTERALGSRGYLARGSVMMEMVETFEAASVAGKLKIKTVTAKKGGKGKSRDDDDVDMGHVNLENIF